MQQQAKNLSLWVKKHTIKLLILGIICVGLLLFFSWFDSALTYSNWKLNFHSPTLNSLWEVAYHKGRLYIAAPEQGKSWVFSGHQVRGFVHKYLIAIRVSIINYSGFFFVILAFIIFKKRAFLWSILKQVKDYFCTLQGLIKLVLLGLFIFSVFPIEEFAYWWQPFKFLESTATKSSFVRLVYDVMKEAVVYEKQRFFYASLFTIPPLVLKLLAAICFGLLLVTYLPVPGFLKKDTPACRPQIIYIFMGIVFILTILPCLRGYNDLLYSKANIAQLFQAKIFQQGKLSFPIEHSREFFNFPFISEETNWHSQIAPGYSFILLLGLFIKLHWLINPVLASLTIFFVYKTVLAIYDQTIAILSAFLLTVSPLFMKSALGGSNLIACAFFLCSGLYFLRQSLDNDKPVNALLTGVLWGIGCLIAPQTTLAFIIPWSIYMIWHEKKYLHLLLFLLPITLGVILLAGYNNILTNRFFHFGYNSLFHARFSSAVQPFEAGLAHISYRLNQINFHFTGQWFPIILFISTIPVWRKAGSVWDRLLLFSLFTLLVSYAIFFTNEADFSNFILGILPFLAILTARGLVLFPDLLYEWGIDRQKTVFILLLVFTINLGLNLPVYFKKPDINNLRQLVKNRKINKAVIFLDPEYYPQGFLNNSPVLDTDIVYARNLGKYNYKLQKEFPGREYLLYQPQQAAGEEFVKVTK